jgi:hypothetical protein
MKQLVNSHGYHSIDPRAGLQLVADRNKSPKQRQLEADNQI